MTLWGRMPRDLLNDLNASFGFDRRLWRQDIQGSEVYCRALARAGLLTESERDSILAGLAQVAKEFESGTFEAAPGDEDIHTAVERRLTDIIGEAGGKLHTGRSRNDQVALDVRLWIMDAVPQIQAVLADLGTALVNAAEPHTGTVMPGFTHLQPAQPVTAAHWLMAHFWPLTRDSARFDEVLAHTRAFCPLGTGALAGNAFPIDRSFLAAELGFDAPAPNSLDAVSDRDPIAEFLFAAALTGVHLSRIAEDVIVYAAWGLVSLADEWTTGSSIMPQKRNPDALELARGKAGRLIGRLSGLLTTLKGLPTAYNKDLQEDKEPLFDAADTLLALLPVLAEVFATLTLHPDAMRAALDVRMLATDLADALVRAGMPFRAAHHVISDLVDEAARRGVRLDELPDAIFFDAGFGADFREILNFDRSVARRDVTGGTAPSAVKAQIEAARAWLEEA